MNSLIQLFVSVLIPLVHAQECPSLAGQWSCAYRDGRQAPFTITIQQSYEGDLPIYRIESPVEGVTELIPDGEVRPSNPVIGQALMRTVCSSGRLITHFEFHSGRERRRIEDSMYPERGGIVRIFRQIDVPPGSSASAVTAFSCKPVIGRR